MNKDILKMEIGKKESPFPTKTSINFISDIQEKRNKTALILFPVFLVILFLFVYFCVIGPLNKVNEAEQKYNAISRQNEAYKKELEDFEEVKREYNELTGNFLNETESAYFERTEIIDMIEEDILNVTELQSIQITGNIIRITTGATTLNDVSSIVETLLSDNRIADANAKTAKASENNSDIYTAVLEIVYGGTEQ